LLVSLRGGTETSAELVMHPLGTLRVSQRLLPLGLILDKVGSQRPSDAKRFEILVTGGGLEKKSDVREKFAMAQFVNMTDADKLSRPSFQPGTGGLELGATGAQLATSHMARRVVRYEQILIDGEFKLHQRKSKFSTGLFAHQLKGSTITTSRLSAAHRSRFNPFGDDKVTVPGEAYTIVHADTNQAFAAAQAFGSEAEAHDHLAQLASANPAEARTLHVVPAWEVAA